VLFVGIDDTDIVGSPGTNQLARAILHRLGAAARDAVICRHQLFFDRRVPYTSKNGSASILLPGAAEAACDEIAAEVRPVMRAWFIEGSDPGLCVTPSVPETVQEFSRRCQSEVVTQDEARGLAAAQGIYLEGLGGTNQGIIGALAAVGLAATRDDGRVVQLARWPYPDDGFAGPQDAAAICARGVDEIRRSDNGAVIASGIVDIGKRLRPNIRQGRVVLFATPAEDASGPAAWRAVKLT
jgi:hypothetical protein